MALLGPLCAVSLALAALLPTPAWAVFVLDTVWSENGGSPSDWGEGFGPAKDLAADPDYDAVVGFWGSFGDDSHFGCSGTWIGNNDDDHAMILTATHCINDIGVNDWSYHTTFGAEFAGVESWVNPLYDSEDDQTNGYDLAIIELDGPIEDVAEPAVLYAGSDELDYYVVTVGYGLRGPGNYANDRKFNTDNEKAAASNVIDVVDELLENGNGANLLKADFDAPDCDFNTLPGEVCPIDEHEGMMGKGDSGGAGFIETPEGVRRIGVNVISDVQCCYGMIGGQARISTQLDWVLSIFPDALTGE